MGRGDWVEVYARARRRAGAVDLDDARAAGIAASSWYDRIAREEWDDRGAGVRLVPGAPLTRAARRHAALLGLGPDALLSHDTALAVHDLDSRRGNRLPVHAVVPYGATTTPPHQTVRHRSRRLGDEDATTVGGLRVTTAARTLIDVASTTLRHRLEAMMLTARQRGLLTPDELRDQLRRRPGLAGARTFRLALAVLEDGAVDSIFEHRTRELIRAHDLPEPVTQYRVEYEGRVLFADFAWPEAGIGLECDGRGFHGPEAFQRDRDRWNDLEDAGLRLVWATWKDVHERPGRLAKRIRDALAGRPAPRPHPGV